MDQADAKILLNAEHRRRQVLRRTTRTVRYGTGHGTTDRYSRTPITHHKEK